MSSRNRTRYVVLGLLTLGPKSGYDLKQDIGASVGFFWQESYGQLYPTLQRLADEGLVERHAQDGGGRGRKVYQITDTGREALSAWLEEPPAEQPIRNELLLKIFLGANASSEVLIRHLEKAKSRYEALAESYDRIAREMDREPDPDRRDRLGRITLEFGILRARAGLEWATRALDHLRALGLDGP